MKISVVVPTVLPDYPIWERPSSHILSYVPEQLVLDQDFDLTEVEVILVDALRSFRELPDMDQVQEYGLTIKHVAPQFGWVLDHRRTSHALLRNTGLVHADGELVILCDDTISFDDPNMLTWFWKEYQKGNAVSPLVYWCCGDVDVGNVHADAADWRWKFLGQKGRWSTADEPQGYLTPVGFGPISFPLEAALELNGYDEILDAGDQYVDTSFGIRLAQHIMPIVIDDRYTCSHEAHAAADPRVLNTYDPLRHTSFAYANAVHCGKTAMLAWREDGFPKRANEGGKAVTDLVEWYGHCPFYMRSEEKHACKSEKDPVCKVPHLARMNGAAKQTFQHWAENIRVFDLKDLRDRRKRKET